MEAPHSSTLAWKIPWTEEPRGLQFMGSLRVGHNRSDLAGAAAAAAAAAAAELGSNLDAHGQINDKEVVVHIHNGILLSHKKGHIFVSSDEVDEPRPFYTE